MSKINTGKNHELKRLTKVPVLERTDMHNHTLDNIPQTFMN